MVVIRRFGGSLNLNVHVHALVLDGVFARDGDGGLTFHHARPLTGLDVDEVLATVEARVGALLDRRGFGAGHAEGAESDAWADDQPVLAGLAATAVQGTVALGSRRGERVGRRGSGSEAPDAPGVDGCRARANGFDLHAGLVVPAGHRARLERVCRYVLRPPVAEERVHLTAEGQVRLEFRRRWRDGTTALVFEPVEFLGRLAVLVPRPRINLVLYHGVLAPRAAWRAAVVRQLPSAGGDGVTDGAPASEPAGVTDPVEAARRQARGQCRASLMARTFGVDVLACPRCGGRLRLIALIEEVDVIGRLLRHLGLPTEVPASRPARAPPPGSDWAEPDPEPTGRDDGLPVLRLDS